MSRKHLVFIAIVVALVFGFGLLLGLVAPRLVGLNTGNRIHSTTTILQQVKTVSELVTVQYVMEKVVILEVPPEGVLAQMFAGENRILLVAHGIVKAGLDLGQLGSDDIVISKKKVRLRLPRARITDAYLDEKQTYVIERTTGRFRSFDKDLEQAARQNAIDDIRRSARACGILKDADARARLQLSNLFRQMGFEQVEFER